MDGCKGAGTRHSHMCTSITSPFDLTAHGILNELRFAPKQHAVKCRLIQQTCSTGPRIDSPIESITVDSIEMGRKCGQTWCDQATGKKQGQNDAGWASHRQWRRQENRTCAAPSVDHRCVYGNYFEREGSNTFFEAVVDHQPPAASGCAGAAL
eukprot:355657-Chlamydomonas_euryale.AAC.6